MQKLDFNVADLVMMGFKGKQLSVETIQTLSKENPSAFILFAHNYESKEQLIQLNEELTARAKNYSQGIPIIISADQEGGRVQRFRSGFTLLPSADRISKTGSPEVAFEIAKIQAKELYMAGLNLNFAPVCDINTNPKNPVIGDRAFGSEEPIVTKMSSAVVRGHLVENVHPCIKHFPGHGDTFLDSHESLPTVHTPLDLLKSREWLPFQRAMKSGAQFLMSAHILLPHLDSEYPGTLSPTFLKHYLRDELMYQGVIVSDDMEMGAITKNYGAEVAPIMALKAGCDLLCYRSEEQAIIAIEAIKKAISDKTLDTSFLRESVSRIKRARSSITIPSAKFSIEERLSFIGSQENQIRVQTLCP